MEENEVLERHRENLRESIAWQREKRQGQSAEEQAGNTHILVEDMHTKMFSRQEAAIKRGRRALREEIAQMTPDELSKFVVDCREEFKELPHPAKRQRSDAWEEEDGVSTTASGTATP